MPFVIFLVFTGAHRGDRRFYFLGQGSGCVTGLILYRFSVRAAAAYRIRLPVLCAPNTHTHTHDYTELSVCENMDIFVPFCPGQGAKHFPYWHLGGKSLTHWCANRERKRCVYQGAGSNATSAAALPMNASDGKTRRCAVRLGLLGPNPAQVRRDSVPRKRFEYES